MLIRDEPQQGASTINYSGHDLYQLSIDLLESQLNLLLQENSSTPKPSVDSQVISQYKETYQQYQQACNDLYAYLNKLTQEGFNTTILEHKMKPIEVFVEQLDSTIQISDYLLELHKQLAIYIQNVHEHIEKLATIATEQIPLFEERIEQFTEIAYTLNGEVEKLEEHGYNVLTLSQHCSQLFEKIEVFTQKLEQKKIASVPPPPPSEEDSNPSLESLVSSKKTLIQKQPLVPHQPKKPLQKTSQSPQNAIIQHAKLPENINIENLKAEDFDKFYDQAEQLILKHTNWLIKQNFSSLQPTTNSTLLGLLNKQLTEFKQKYDGIWSILKIVDMDLDIEPLQKKLLPLEIGLKQLNSVILISNQYIQLEDVIKKEKNDVMEFSQKINTIQTPEQLKQFSRQCEFFLENCNAIADKLDKLEAKGHSLEFIEPIYNELIQHVQYVEDKLALVIKRFQTTP